MQSRSDVQYHSSDQKFRPGKWSGAASPVRFHKIPTRQGDTFTWLVSVGVSCLPIAWGPAASVSEGMRIFREAEARYWRRRRLSRPIKRQNRLLKRSTDV